MPKRRMPPSPPPSNDPGRFSPPKCKAILLCGKVEFNPFTRMPTVCDIIDAWASRSFPFDTGPFTVYLQLTCGIGECLLDVEFYHTETNERINGGWKGITIDFTVMESKAHIPVPIRSLPIKRPGLYDVVVVANEREIARQQFEVDQLHEV